MIGILSLSITVIWLICSWVKCTIENEKAKGRLYTIPATGDEYYFDRLGNTYLKKNGRRIDIRADGTVWYVGSRLNDYLISPEDVENRQHERVNANELRSANKLNLKACKKWSDVYHMYVTTEISTGKPIAILLKDEEKGLYKKYYCDIVQDCYPGKPHTRAFTFQNRRGYNEISQHNKGVKITKKEYHDLNCAGTHKTYDSIGMLRKFGIISDDDIEYYSYKDYSKYANGVYKE